MRRTNPRRARTPAIPKPIDLAAAGGILAVALALLSGCAGSNRSPISSGSPSPPPVIESYADAPNWVTAGCRAHWPDDAERKRVVCGIGSAPSNRNRVAARETAVSRARSAIARSIEVTIESLVRLEDREGSSSDGNLRSIVHQLSSASLPGCQIESVWHSNTGATYALVSLGVEKVQQTVRNARSLSPAAREDLARRAADAFAQMEAQIDSVSAENRDEGALR